MSEPGPIHPLSIFQTEEGRQAAKEADVILGCDEGRGGKEVLFYRRATLERIAVSGVEGVPRVFRISYDSRTDQLEYLVAAVNVIKGSCCYEASGPQPPVFQWLHPDGTLETHTTDADPWFAEDRAREDSELQAALDTLRARGVARPVVISCTERGEKAARFWALLKPTLIAAGIPVFSAAEAGCRHYVVPVDVAREALRAVFGKSASRHFRLPSWPVSYWSVNIGSEHHEVYESRTFKDIAEAEKK